MGRCCRTNSRAASLLILADRIMYAITTAALRDAPAWLNQNQEIAFQVINIMFKLLLVKVTRIFYGRNSLWNNEAVSRELMLILTCHNPWSSAGVFENTFAPLCIAMCTTCVCVCVCVCVCLCMCVCVCTCMFASTRMHTCMCVHMCTYVWQQSEEDSYLWPFDHEFSTLTTELSPIPHGTESRIPNTLVYKTAPPISLKGHTHMWLSGAGLKEKLWD